MYTDMQQQNRAVTFERFGIFVGAIVTLADEIQRNPELFDTPEAALTLEPIARTLDEALSQLILGRNASGENVALLSDELQEYAERLTGLEANYYEGEFSDEERGRLDLAADVFMEIADTLDRALSKLIPGRMLEYAEDSTD